MPGESSSFGFDVVVIGVGSYHVTLPPSEEGYFRLQLHYITTMLAIPSNEDKLSYDFEFKDCIQFRRYHNLLLSI